MGLYNDLPDKSYIKQLLHGISEEFSEKFLSMLTAYRSSKDAVEKREYRERLTSLFWELFKMIASDIKPNLPVAKKLFIRYGLADLRGLTPEDQKFILAQASNEVNYDEEIVYYLDEWLIGIAFGKLKASAGNELKNKGAKKPLNENQEKHISLLEVEQGHFKEFKKTRDNLLFDLSYDVDTIKEEHIDENTGLTGVFTQEQTKALENITYYQKEIKKLNKEILASAKTMQKAQDALEAIRIEEEKAELAKEEGEENTSFNKEALLQEIDNMRQMVKMTVGRQGNSYPFLNSSFMPKETKEYLFKNIVKRKLNKWLNIDPEAFSRTYKGQTMSIPPYMILVPGYGTTGVCWDPLNKNNKQFSKGRIVLPIFSKVPDLSLLSAMGDLRWQTAKEISFYWMEEGLTGNYYNYYLDAKLKGDMRLSFISDYLSWMTKETQGIQKLDQEARYVFWRYVPLPDEDKINLSKRGYYYSQLWEKEQVWRRAKNR